MKVRDLIALLQQHDPDAEAVRWVDVHESSGPTPIEGVRVLFGRLIEHPGEIVWHGDEPQPGWAKLIELH